VSDHEPVRRLVTNVNRANALALAFLLLAPHAVSGPFDFAQGVVGGSGTPQPPTLKIVLERAGAYVEQFERQLSGIVAEEAYEQVVRRAAPTSVVLERRQLKSDLLLMQPTPGYRWVQFRDVFEVDGRPVRDREDRLASLFLAPSTSLFDRVARIRRESARYNIGNIDRTMNIPVLPLGVLVRDEQSRFSFSIQARGKGSERGVHRDLPDSPHFRVSTEVWVVAFRESQGPTMVRTPEGRDVFSRGRLWIEPSTGRVLMAEVTAGGSQVKGQITVSFQSEPLVGFLVPVEMRESYQRSRDTRVIEGVATYGKFRQFRVEVDEQIGPIR
jgi:hypothetical protein